MHFQIYRAGALRLINPITAYPECTKPGSLALCGEGRPISRLTRKNCIKAHLYLVGCASCVPDCEIDTTLFLRPITLSLELSPVPKLKANLEAQL